MSSLHAQIERITYANEETGYAVAKVYAKGHEGLVAVITKKALAIRNNKTAIPGQRPWSGPESSMGRRLKGPHVCCFEL